MKDKNKPEQLKLDLKDKKILAELDFGARQPISKLAKKLRISRQVAIYRIEKLEAEKIIENYYAVINNAKLGYYYCRLVLKFQNLSKEAEEEIVKYCKENKRIGFYGILDGAWDLVIGYWAKQLNEFENFVDEFVYKFGHYILEKEISIGLYVWSFQHRYLLGKKETKEFITGSKIEEEKIDDLNKKLLSLLTKNARLSLVELSEKLRLTAKAVNYRIKNLMKKKILLGFRTKINYKRFGYYNNKVFLYLQNLTKANEAELISYLRSLPSCIYITKALGKPDLEFEVLVKSREEFFSIIKNLREKFKNIIRSYDQFIIHEEPISRFIPIE